MLQLEDLLPFYETSLPRNQYQGYLSSLQEFAILKPDNAQESLPTRGQWFRHQLFDMRFMRAYDNLFLLDEMGTGKSGVIVSIAEDLMRDPDTPYYRTFILVKGKNLAQEWQRQITCLAPAGRYDDLNPEVARANTNQHRNTLIKQEIKRFYSIWTYNRFVKQVSELYNTGGEEAVRKFFLGTIIYVDEIHNLKLTTDNDIPSDVAASNQQEQASLKPEKTGTYSKIQKYNAIQMVFRLVSPMKRILGSGSAMVNVPEDIAALINLFPGYQLPVDAQYWNTVGLEQLAQAAGNLFTYIRAIDSGIEIKYGGIPLPDRVIPTLSETEAIKTSRKVLLLPMTEWQSEQYYRIKGSDNDEASSAFDIGARQATNIIYPEADNPNQGLAGEQGYRQIIQPDPNRKTLDDRSRLSSYGEQLLNWDNLPNISIKMAYILNVIKEDMRQGIRRKYYIYADFLFAGAYPVAKVMERNGFSRLDTRKSIFAAINDEDKILPYCASRDLSVEQTPRIAKAERYVVVKESSPFQLISEAWNAAANFNGDYVRIVILSRSGREGLNLTETTRMFLLQSEWNPSRERQAIFRILRSGAFRRTKANLTPGTNIEVVIDRMAAVPLTKDQRQDYTNRNRNNNYLAQITESVDTVNYYRTAFKERRIGRLMRIFKQIALTCPTFYPRNVWPQDQDYSPDCDFQICEYQCYATGQELDPATKYDNYDNLYASSEMEVITGKLRELFIKYFDLSWPQVLASLAAYRPSLVLRTVVQIIERRTIFYDRFGFESYLQENGDLLTLTHEYPLAFTSKYSLANSYYAEHQIRIREQNLGEVWAVSATGQKELNAIYQRVMTEAEMYMDLVRESTNVYIIAQLVEAYYLYQYQGQAIDPKLKAFVHELRKEIFSFDYPYQAIEQDLDRKGQTLVAAENQKDTILVHIIYRNRSTSAAFGELEQRKRAEGRMRIFRPLEAVKWREATEYEHKAIQPLIAAKLSETKRTGQPYWGSFNNDGKFVFHDGMSELKALEAKIAQLGPNATADRIAQLKGNAKNKYRGGVCVNKRSFPLIRALYYLKAQPPEFTIPGGRMFPLEAKMKVLQQKLADVGGRKNLHLEPEVQADPDFFFKWVYIFYQGKIGIKGLANTNLGGRTEVCNVLQQALQDRGWFDY